MIETNFDYNWKGAAETLRKALALAPQDPALLMEAGNLAQARGENTQGLDLFRRAVALDPVNAQARAFLAGSLSVAGKQKEARAEYAREIELNPSAPNSHAGIGLTYLLEGKFEEAAVVCAKGCGRLGTAAHRELRALGAKTNSRIRCGACGIDRKSQRNRRVSDRRGLRVSK